jgi:hypothetical protein
MVISLLENPELAVLQCATSIVEHFSANGEL